ncbi:MAG: nucleotidyltransferase domain-containing protein [Defluviitaleaceae bacterium]|nr:nucleotidyltransferase domain-containing protein [Defluviitaleaceae bacterium]MCL2276027.1 nucleotidyltransferase domain-containing protein [Defluviitaleaceae bacterium]
MRSIDNIQSELNDFIERVAVFPLIAQIYLFGSYARGTAGVTSDVDIAIIKDEAPSPREENQFRKAIAIARSDSLIEPFNPKITYVLTSVFATDEYAFNISSSIRREGVLLWQR